MEAGQVERLKGQDFLGACITVPHKETVIPFLDELDREVQRIGATNCIVNAGGRLAGDITPFAGSVVQLTFSTVSASGQGGSLYFDDIRFSSVVVPEPAGLRILGIGVLCLVWRSRAKTRDWQVSFRHPRRRPCSTLDYRPR